MGRSYGILRGEMRKGWIRGFVVLAAVVCAVGVFACEAITKKGEKCKRAPMEGSAYCWQHGGRTAKTNTVAKVAAAKPKRDDNAERVRCDAVTKKGARCTRLALPGGTKCWQHQ